MSAAGVDRRAAFVGLCGLPLVLPTPTAPASSVGRPARQDDDHLVALGRRLAQLSAIERAMPDDVWHAADKHMSETKAVLAEIVGCQATSISGLRVKAEALRHCYSGDDFDESCLSGSTEPPTTDLRLVVGIYRDLLALT